MNPRNAAYAPLPPIALEQLEKNGQQIKLLKKIPQKEIEAKMTRLVR